MLMMSLTSGLRGRGGKVAEKGIDHVTLSLTHYIYTTGHAYRCHTNWPLWSRKGKPPLLHQNVMSALIAVFGWNKSFDYGFFQVADSFESAVHKCSWTQSFGIKIRGQCI